MGYNADVDSFSLPTAQSGVDHYLIFTFFCLMPLSFKKSHLN